MTHLLAAAAAALCALIAAGHLAAAVAITAALCAALAVIVRALRDFGPPLMIISGPAAGAGPGEDSW